MAAVLERSFIEICGFERESVQRFRDVTVDLGKRPHCLTASCSARDFKHGRLVRGFDREDVLSTANVSS